jgi:hypothetical protein
MDFVSSLQGKKCHIDLLFQKSNLFVPFSSSRRNLACAAGTEISISCIFGGFASPSLQRKKIIN